MMLIALGILALTIASSSSAAQSADLEGEIVYVSGHFYYDVAVVSATGIKFVTQEDDSYTRLITPQWSPDATRIAFTDGINIYSMNVDGSDLVQLTNYDDPASPSIVNISWAQDGQTIAATLYAEEVNHSGYWIRLIDIKTLDERDITSGEYSDGFFGISWSPDGRFIVFTSNQDGYVPAATGLYVLNVETGDVSALTDVSSRVRFDRYPSWSPDGARIAFISENFEDGGWDIYLINADGSNLQRLTNRPNTPEINNIFHVGGTIDWSPDSKRIVFTACPNPYPEGCELFTIDLDGQNLTQITYNQEAGAFDPSWKPHITEVSE